MTQVSDTDLSIIIPVYQDRIRKSVQTRQSRRLPGKRNLKSLFMKNSTREFPPQEITELTMPAERGFFSWMQMITSVQMLLGKSVPC